MKTIKRWVNFYPPCDDTSGGHPWRTTSWNSRELADAKAQPGRIACVAVEFQEDNGFDSQETDIIKSGSGEVVMSLCGGERPTRWVDRLFCGPRHWPALWRRAWLVTLPVSWIIWPVMAILIAACGLCFWIGGRRFMDWFTSIWNSANDESAP